MFFQLIRTAFIFLMHLAAFETRKLSTRLWQFLGNENPIRTRPSQGFLLFANSTFSNEKQELLGKLFVSLFSKTGRRGLMLLVW